MQLASMLHPAINSGTAPMPAAAWPGRLTLIATGTRLHEQELAYYRFLSAT
jgi:hypothetical protein